jgi:hypothetical protein
MEEGQRRGAIHRLKMCFLRREMLVQQPLQLRPNFWYILEFIAFLRHIILIRPIML